MRVLHTLALITPILIAGCETNQRHAGYGTSPTYGGDVISTPPVSSIDADRALADSVRQQLSRYGDLSALASNIQVSARDGVVTLNGTVPSESERRMVHAAVENTTGVRALYDQLKIASITATPTYPYNQNNSVLANRVRDALRNQPTLASVAPSIQIVENNGTITLSGPVPRQEDRQLIESVVRNTPGVVSVNDYLSLAYEPTGRTAATAGDMFNLHVEGLTGTDRALAQNILQGLRTDTILGSLLPMVDIHVSQGKVTLQGTVQNEQQKRAIASAVQRAAGAGNVDDQLQVFYGR